MPPREVRLSLTQTLIVRSTIQKRGVRTLLMGGQACVFYGGAEFSAPAARIWHGGCVR